MGLFQAAYALPWLKCDRVNGGRLCPTPDSEELCLTPCGTHDLWIVPTLFPLKDRETPRLSLGLFLASSVCVCVSVSRRCVSTSARPADPPNTGKEKYSSVRDEYWKHVDKSMLHAQGCSGTIRSDFSVLFLESLLIFHPAAAVYGGDTSTNTEPAGISVPRFPFSSAAADVLPLWLCAATFFW